MNNKEVWKDIIGYEGLYKVSNFGNIFSLTSNKILKQRISKGYYIINLTKDGKPKTYSVHRIVAFAFIENKENKREVNHIDEDKLNNKVENLSWVTSKENSNHGTRNERIKLNHRKSWNGIYNFKDHRKLSKIRSICKETKKVTEFSSLKEAVIKTGIHQPNISSCLNGKMISAGGYFWERVI